MEHRHNHQHPIAFAQGDVGSAGDHHRMHIGAAMAIHHTFRVSGGSAGVTHGHTGSLVHVGIGKARRLGSQQFVVVQGRTEQGRVDRAAHDDVFDRRQLIADPSKQRSDRGVNDDHLVPSVVDDIGELLGKEPNVQRVKHRSHTRNRQVGLHVRLVVPHKGANSISVTDSQTGKCGGQLISPIGNFGEGGNGIVGPVERRNRGLRMNCSTVLQNRTDCQWKILHCGKEHLVTVANASRTASARDGGLRRRSKRAIHT